MKPLNSHGASLNAGCSWLWPEVTCFVYIRFVGMSRLLLLSLLAAVGAALPSGNSSQSSTEAPRNTTISPAEHSFGSFLGTELPVLQRAFYVLSGVCLLGVVYCTVRSVRLRKPERKKYGLLANYDENMEMGSVDSDEDTVFESKMLRR